MSQSDKDWKCALYSALDIICYCSNCSQHWTSLIYICHEAITLYQTGPWLSSWHCYTHTSEAFSGYSWASSKIKSLSGKTRNSLGEMLTASSRCHFRCWKFPIGTQWLAFFDLASTIVEFLSRRLRMRPSLYRVLPHPSDQVSFLTKWLAKSHLWRKSYD